MGRRAAGGVRGHPGAGRTQALEPGLLQPDSGRCSVLLLTSPSILWEA